MTALQSAMLFPGQGAFAGNQLRYSRRSQPAVDDVFSAVDKVSLAEFGRALSEIVFGPDQPELAELLADEPWVSQLAIFANDLVAFRALNTRGFTPDLLMGHSLGEIAALTAGGAFSIETGARIIANRVQVLQKHENSGGSMLALSTDATRAQQIIDLIADPNVVVAVENHARQTVISGPPEPMEALGSIARALRIGSVTIRSPHPFHNPLLKSAAAEFAASIRELAIGNQLGIPVYSPVLGRHYGPDDVLSDLLAEHFIRPVRFAEALRVAHHNGVRLFLESGALDALTGFAAKVLVTDELRTYICFDNRPLQPGEPSPLESTINALRGLGLLPADPARELATLLVPGVDPDSFAGFWAARGAGIADRIAREFVEFTGSGTSTDGPPVALTNGNGSMAASTDGVPLAGAAPGQLNREQLTEEISQLYADALEYPVEVFTEDVQLEAELGVDSVKQVELLSRISEHYGLPARRPDFRLGDYDTVGKIIDFVQAEISQHPGRTSASTGA